MNEPKFTLEEVIQELEDAWTTSCWTDDVLEENKDLFSDLNENIKIGLVTLQMKKRINPNSYD